MADTGPFWMLKGGLRRIVLLLLTTIATLSVAAADEVHLKDGQTLRTPRAWVEGGYAHFILQGTGDVEIRYALEIVDRIVAADGKQIFPADSPVEPQEPAAIPMRIPQPDKPSEGDAKRAEGEPTEGRPVKPVSRDQAAVTPAVELPVPVDLDTRLLRARAKKLRETPFYDPRRQEKYWASAQSRHNKVDGAVDALAELFKQSPQWVTSHMGSTNDLGEIHLNLIRQLENGGPKAPSPRVTPPKAVPTKAAAPKAEATSGSGVPAGKPAAQRPTTANKAVRASNPFASNLPATKGPFFYSPRRPQKFWANETSRHNTLDDALKALADQYGRPVAWIESHMGESNSLQEIHHNLTSAAEDEIE